MKCVFCGGKTEKKKVTFRYEEDDKYLFDSYNPDEKGVLTVVTYLANKGKYCIGWNNFWGPRFQTNPRTNKRKGVTEIFRFRF